MASSTSLLLFALSLSIIFCYSSCEGTNYKEIHLGDPVVHLAPSPLDGYSSSRGAKDMVSCGRVRVAGISRWKIKSNASSVRITLTPSAEIPKSLYGKIEVCFLWNSSLGLCQCTNNDWKSIQKGLWSASMSPYDDRYIDVKFNGEVTGSVTVTIEEGEFVERSELPVFLSLQLQLQLPLKLKLKLKNFMESHDGASSSPSSLVSSFTHDVFLSFRGPDTGNSFTAFLQKRLVREGVAVYIDREDLRAGEEIKSALFKAIQGSKISIPVFSKGYADSRWCLDELVEIIRCYRDNRQIILPVFLDVDPTDVRRQTGSFKASFDNHKDRFDEQTRNSWKEALKEVADISGYDLGQVTGNQSKLVESIVERVLSESSGKRLDDAKNLVGLKTRVKAFFLIANRLRNFGF